MFIVHRHRDNNCYCYSIEENRRIFSLVVYTNNMANTENSCHSYGEIGPHNHAYNKHMYWFSAFSLRNIEPMKRSKK